MTDTEYIKAGVAVLIYFLLRIFINRSVDRISTKNKAPLSRRKIMKKAINFTLLSVLIVVIFSIFGVNRSEIVVFVGSLLTILGIAFFAQWSILSNITSGLIIFFNHPVKLDDTLLIMDSDFPFEGTISDIGLFFVILKTKEGEKVTIPNNVFIQKMIKKKSPS
jgi:small-conductance mechanosensitive channel